jgi:L-fuconolactonase
MINFPIVDTHLHVWDPKKLRYPWLDENPFLNKPYLLDDYSKACGKIHVEKMVFVQAEADFSQYKEEADWVSTLAEKEPRLSGIVPWAPLEKGAEAEAELAVLAENKLVKGIRRIIQFEPDMEFCLKPDFIKGVRLLPKYGLHFEICIAHIHMANTIAFARKCPDVRFILNHIAKPDIKNQNLDPWRKHMKEFSDMPNVWCKMSGLVTEADHAKWKRGHLKPYIDHVLDCFGFDRIMYGGDWPVAFQAAKYPIWVKALEWAVQGCTHGELTNLFRNNAISFYRLDNEGDGTC